MNTSTTEREIKSLLSLCGQYNKSMEQADLLGTVDAFYKLYSKALEYIGDLTEDPEFKVAISESTIKSKYEHGKNMAIAKAVMEYNENFISDSRKKPLT